MLDEVERTHTSIIITKHGRAVARLVPIEDDRSAVGSVTLLTDDDDDLFSTGEAWDAD